MRQRTTADRFWEKVEPGPTLTLGLDELVVTTTDHAEPRVNITGDPAAHPAAIGREIQRAIAQRDALDMHT